MMIVIQCAHTFADQLLLCLYLPTAMVQDCPQHLPLHPPRHRLRIQPASLAALKLPQEAWSHRHVPSLHSMERR